MSEIIRKPSEELINLLNTFDEAFKKRQEKKNKIIIIKNVFSGTQSIIETQYIKYLYCPIAKNKIFEEFFNNAVSLLRLDDPKYKKRRIPHMLNINGTFEHERIDERGFCHVIKDVTLTIKIYGNPHIYEVTDIYEYDIIPYIHYYPFKDITFYWELKVENFMPKYENDFFY